MTARNEGKQKKREILIVCESFVRQNIMKNVLSLIFPGAELIIKKDMRDALVYLCVCGDKTSYIFCCHNGLTNGIEFLQMWQKNEKFKPIPFIIIVMEENFVRVGMEAEARGAIFIRFPDRTDRKVCAALIAKKLLEGG